MPTLWKKWSPSAAVLQASVPSLSSLPSVTTTASARPDCPARRQECPLHARQHASASAPGACNASDWRPGLRPAECHAVITSTADMDAQAASLSELAAVVWLGGNRPSVCASVIRDAIASSAGIDRSFIRVVPFFPEDFLVRFDYPHHRDIAAAAPGRFSYYSSDYGNLDIHIAKWRLNAHADIVQANFHVHLCIENVPLNASNDAVAAQVLGPNTFLHYFDIASA
ncbi:hypothetical protein ZWY2020_034093 [Hordeum vulgare]|nr:hypothetical protein ZWY2020_034093 [Hordeum vulgare]